MSFLRIAAKATLGAAVVLLAPGAFAHPKLLSSTPQDASVGSAPVTIELKFSETLTTQFSGAKLVMTEMPGIPNHGDMAVNAVVSGGSDDKTLVIKPTTGLSAGKYRVDWRAVSSDAHPITGTITFQVQ